MNKKLPENLNIPKIEIDPTKFEWAKPNTDTDIFEIKSEDGRTLESITLNIVKNDDKYDIGNTLEMYIQTSYIPSSAFSRYDTEHENAPYKTELVIYAKALIRGYIYRLELTREATWEYGCEIHEYN